MRVWYRGVTHLLFTQGLPGDLIALQSIAAKLPLEIIEMIIMHLIYDTRSLLACSLTCFSWNIAAVPHLHHTIVMRNGKPCLGREPKLEWPTPLEKSSNLGLLPLVKKFWLRRVIDRCCSYGPFTPKRFNFRILLQISEMTNIQELVIDDLAVSDFIPRVRHYFGHFLPMVRSLGLDTPRGSRREIIFFIGLFEHLEDLTLVNDKLITWEDKPVDNSTLVPPFAPPLRGRLVMANFESVGFLKDMVNLFGRVRFRYVDLRNVGEARFLLKACAKTLETVRLCPPDPTRERLRLKRV